MTPSEWLGIGSSYRPWPAILCYIGWRNRFQGSLKVKNTASDVYILSLLTIQAREVPAQHVPIQHPSGPSRSCAWASPSWRPSGIDPNNGVGIDDIKSRGQIRSPWLGGYSRLWRRIDVPARQATYVGGPVRPSYARMDNLPQSGPMNLASWFAGGSVKLKQKMIYWSDQKPNSRTYNFVEGFWA